ncbi:MAG TPA: hypothetical protein VFE46_13350, partial [Pirellulales bacterium]|nr:hypothetical protein [Pirellulales bacterium]
MHWRLRMACVTVLSASSASACAVLLGGPAQADDQKTGGFETTFTERSPQSELKALAKRLKLLNPGDKIESLQDYDLSKEGWWVYVPEKYDPAKPMGLLVLALYKHADSLPPAVLPQLADANMALIVPKEYLDAWWKRAGLMLDAAYNMPKLYKIDPKRVYIFGSNDWADADGKMYCVGLRTGLFYPEVFTGIFLSNGLQSYRQVKATGNSFYQAQIPKPDGAQLQLARNHPFVVGRFDNPEDTATAAAYKADGFKYGKVIPVTTEQYHYPNFTTDWLP